MARKAARKKPEAPTEENRDDMIEKIRISKEVMIAASPEEIQSAGMALAKVDTREREIEEEIRKFVKPLRKEQKKLEKERAELARSITSNTVKRMVSCFEVRDFRLNQIRWEDDDGKEICKSEVMPAEMRQQQLFDDDGAEPRVEVDEEDA